MLLRENAQKGSYLMAFGISLKALGYPEQARQSFKQALKDRSLSVIQKGWLQQQLQLLGNN